MLKTLKIRHFAIIDSVEIEFGAGLNILSGETGAGKSIIMDALFLILGGRASADLVRKGAEEACVEALFDISQDKELLALLDELGFPAEDGELIVRRLVQSSGKSRIFLNGSMANTATLAQVTGKLVDLCSQHDQQLLSRPEEQLLWIDRFGKLELPRAEVKALYGAWKEKQRRLLSLSADIADRTQRIDFLRFQLQELHEAELRSPGEDQEIEQELKALNNAEALFGFAAEATEALSGGGEESLPLLNRTTVLLQKARALANADPRLLPLAENLHTIKMAFDEANDFLRNYAHSLSRDEGRLEALNARGALLAKLKRKYGPTLQDVLDNEAKFQNELTALENHESFLTDAEAEATRAHKEFQKAALSLRGKRAVVAKEFSAVVVKELAELHMERARFEASLSELAEASASGLDAAKFLIAANPGEPMNALNKVASGGELSRIMLAIHNVVSSRGGVGVFLFDEVDTGIGGKTAVVVGAKLQHVARNNQVICITHLPQVAAFANRHYSVEKQVVRRSGDERTVTSVLPLETEEARASEIARMLGGSEKDKAALSAALSMLKRLEMAPGAAPPSPFRDRLAQTPPFDPPHWARQSEYSMTHPMGHYEFLYIHIPFCDVICHYCDFYTARSQEARQEEFFRALHQELSLYGEKLAPSLKSVYFGGGTPGVSPPELLQDFLFALRPHIQADTEITLEVNPNNVTREKVRAWRAAGFTRLSMGIQSLRKDLLKRLGRTHSANDAKQALSLCLTEFENVTGDLLYGVPGQDSTTVAKDAEDLANLGLPHISAYHLTLAPKHFLYAKLPGDEPSFQQIAGLADTLANRGFRHYEISNFGKPGFESRHNQNYWLGGAYLALGPSAHGYDGHGERWKNNADWELYCRRLQEGELPVESRETLSLEQKKIEYLFTRLRLINGINLKEFHDLFGVKLENEKSELFAALEKEGLGTIGSGHFRPSFRGRMLGDELVQRLL